MKRSERKKELQHRITFRLGAKDLERLDALLAESSCMSYSELIRKQLFKGRIIIHTYDRTLDMVMETLSGIRTELHAIGINVNQVTRRFHIEKLPDSRLVRAMEIQELSKQTGAKVEELLEIINKLSERWLQE